MNSIQRKVTATLATGSLLLGIATPVMGGTTLIITGNGAESDNDVNVEVEQTTEVVQDNVFISDVDVDAYATSGENTASRNTGGDVTIDTGNATTDVYVDNMANSNVADVECCQSDVEAEISGNGYNSDNDIDFDYNEDDDAEIGIGVYQENFAKVDVDVDAGSYSGDNTASRNTGGDVEIFTGDAETFVDVMNTLNSNSARVGGNGDGDGPMLSMRILDNGADTTNLIDLEYEKSIVVVQDNLAKIKVDVDADASTGYNRASRNTGGGVLIDTGNALVDVYVDNMANFNSADVDCDCLMDVVAKIAGNGYDSDNDIIAELEDGLEVFQDNVWKCGGHRGRGHRRGKDCVDVDAYADSGYNSAKGNTGDPGDDPEIWTGDADAYVDVINTGNSNVFGESFEWPEFPSWDSFGFSLNLSLSWGDLLALLG